MRTAEPVRTATRGVAEDSQIFGDPGIQMRDDSVPFYRRAREIDFMRAEALLNTGGSRGDIACPNSQRQLGISTLANLLKNTKSIKP